MIVTEAVHKRKLSALYHTRMSVIFNARGKRTRLQDIVLGIFLFALETQRMYHLRELGYVAG